MRHISQWFSVVYPEDDPRWEADTPWYNRTIFDRYTERYRLAIGDIIAEFEPDGGESHGLDFGVSLRLWENAGDFDWVADDQRWGPFFESHSFSLIFWRWGIAFSVRGKRIK